MRKFNSVFIDAFKENEHQMEECGLFLSACLSEEDLKVLRELHSDTGGLLVRNWWRFVFENTIVELSIDYDKIKDDMNKYKKENGIAI